MDPKRFTGSILALGVALAAASCSTPTGPADLTEYKSVTIRYERVLPAPIPGGVGQPSLHYLYYHGGETQEGTVAMISIDENTFSVVIGIRTETQIGVYVVDPKYADWVCQSLFVEALDVTRQAIPAAGLYGQTAFILGNDGIVRSPGI
jgi:hypothetical protein